MRRTEKLFPNVARVLIEHERALHGGLSTSPRTPEGKARSALNGRLGGRPRKRSPREHKKSSVRGRPKRPTRGVLLTAEKPKPVRG